MPQRVLSPPHRLQGMRPEFIDSLFPSESQGRDVTRVKSFGVVKARRPRHAPPARPCFAAHPRRRIRSWSSMCRCRAWSSSGMPPRRNRGPSRRSLLSARGDSNRHESDTRERTATDAAQTTQDGASASMMSSTARRCMAITCTRVFQKKTFQKQSHGGALVRRGSRQLLPKSYSAGLWGRPSAAL